MNGKKNEKENTSPNEQKPEELRTLGILLVHGIGTQRRGDTLIQVGNALRSWIEQFLRLQRTEVPVVETSLTSADASDGAPPQASIYFKDPSKVSSLTWKLAESHWAESFPAPTYWEFARWAIRILPLAILFHMAPRIRTASEFVKADRERDKNTGRISPATASKLLDTSELPERERLLKDFSGSFAPNANRALGRVLLNFLFLPIYAIVLLLIQSLLLLFLVFAWLPFDFIKSATKRIQTSLSATVGDSCLFTTNPIIESAIVSKVQRDIERLADSCDRVVVIAHSQGAAVAYQAIEQWTWRQKLPSRLELLITYGSGLQKLLDLKVPLQSATAAKRLGLLAQVSSTVLAILTIYLFLLLRADASTGFGIATGVAALLSWFALIVASFLTADILDVRARLLEIDWDVYYASNDPVSNGRTYLSESQVRNRERFYANMREVVNFRSTLWDHTTYWKGVDDFVARVVVSLFERSNVSLHRTTPEWLNECAARRRWRVRYLSACRSVTFITLIAVTFVGWQRLDVIGSSIVNWLDSAGTYLPQIPDVDISTVESVPMFLLGEAALVLMVFLIFIVAKIGWAMWNDHEMMISFWRVGFAASKVGVLLFGLGWMGLMAFPVLVAVAFDEASTTTWIEPGLAVSLVGLITLRALWTGRTPPGSVVSRATAALDAAERVIESKDRIDLTALDEARFRFRSAGILLADRGNPETHVRALQGWEKALDRIADSQHDDYEYLGEYASRALNRVRRKKLDDSGLVALLDRLKNRRPPAAA